MAHFELKIEADDLIAAIKELAVAIKEAAEGGSETAKAVVKTPAPSGEEKQVGAALETPAGMEEEKPITLEQIKQVLADKAIEGKSAGAKALVAKYGAKKLTDIDPAKYPDLLKEAKAL